MIQPRNPHRRPDVLVSAIEPPPSSDVLSGELDYDDTTPVSQRIEAAFDTWLSSEPPPAGSTEDAEEDSPPTRRSWMASLPPPLPDTEH